MNKIKKDICFLIFYYLSYASMYFLICISFRLKCYLFIYLCIFYDVIFLLL